MSRQRNRKTQRYFVLAIHKKAYFYFSFFFLNDVNKPVKLVHLHTSFQMSSLLG